MLKPSNELFIISLICHFLIFSVFERHPELSEHCSDWITRVQETKTKYDSTVQYGFVFCACGTTKSNIFWIFMTLSRMIPRVVLWICFQKNLLQQKRFFLPRLFSTVNTSGQYSPDRTKNVSVTSPFYSKHQTNLLLTPSDLSKWLSPMEEYSYGRFSLQSLQVTEICLLETILFSFWQICICSFFSSKNVSISSS